MKQLTGLDATFLFLETASQFGHVSSYSVFERPDEPYEPLAAWRQQIERRLHLLEPLRRRLREVPLGLDHPYWIDDPDFDLDFHVRHTAVAPPGDDQQIGDLVARIVGRPLDRRRPLWESYVIEGLPDDRFAILTKVHHATVDGASGVELLTLMLDTDPDGDELPAADHAWIPDRVPSDGEMVLRGLGGLVRKPARAALLSARTVRELGRATRNPVMVAAANQVRSGLRGPLGAVLNIGRSRDTSVEPVGPLPTLSPPRTPFNATITPHRRFAFRSVPLQTIKDIKSALGATVNDVVMAACAGGLRTWLELHDALPDGPLVAMIPVSVRTGEEAERWTNRVSAIFASLPVDEPDPLERVRRVHEAMVDAKQLFDAVPAESLTDFAQFPPPAVFALAMRTATRLTGRYGMPVNVVISNVPGPREPLYAAGAKLLHYYPVSTIVDGQGLNVTVQSYLDTLDFGLVSCRELVPDLWDMVDAMVDDVALLAKAAGVAGPNG
ncbi:MAG: wax ester synthase/diacylglycerol acyltransferase [Acidimicrobiales bacterium]|nr:wax ester synthase/diacylglycerol acyltransferase [Acidimicrobiales bacterium]